MWCIIGASTSEPLPSHLFGFLFLCVHVYIWLSWTVMIFAFKTHDPYLSLVVLIYIQDNQTALHTASYNGHDEVVRVLLAAKATVNTQTKVS